MPLEKLVAKELGRRELEMARDVQRRLLPPSKATPMTTSGGRRVASKMLSARSRRLIPRVNQGTVFDQAVVSPDSNPSSKITMLLKMRAWTLNSFVSVPVEP